MGPRRRPIAGRQVTPAERDEVRGLADRHLAYHPGGLSTCTDCANAHAVLRYVPPGDVDEALERDRENPSLDVIRSSFEDGDAVMVYGLDDEPLSPADARLLAHALHAAADAAEES